METNKKDLQDITFESAIARLEEIVKALENGSAPLDQSLELFEEGVSLVKICNERLDKAEQKIKILASDGEGNMVETDFKKTEG